ncbi:MAG TPA: hypothetical protein VF331_19140 [Polyangiales bacterium]
MKKKRKGSCSAWVAGDRRSSLEVLLARPLDERDAGKQPGPAPSRTTRTQAA